MRDDGSEDHSAEVDKLAGVAESANLATAVAELQGQLVHFIDRETRAYKAWAGEKWTDDGLSAWIAARTEELQACFRADVDELTGGDPP